jgi:predicted tellurium resistance membrane protein TerC
MFARLESRRNQNTNLSTRIATVDFADAAATVDSILAPVALAMGRTRD